MTENDERTEVVPRKGLPAIEHEIVALRQFARALEAMDEAGRRAAMYWLVERYLGIRLG